MPNHYVLPRKPSDLPSLPTILVVLGGLAALIFLFFFAL